MKKNDSPKKPKGLAKDYFIVTKIISKLSNNSEELSIRVGISTSILSALAFILIYFIDIYYDTQILEKPTLILIIIWFIFAPIIIDLIELQIDRFGNKYKRILKDKKEDSKEFIRVIKYQLLGKDSNPYGTVFLGTIILLIIYYLIPVGIGKDNLDMTARIILTLMCIFPAILISNMLMISFNLVNALPQICKFKIKINPHYLERLRDLGGMNKFIFSTVLLISSVSLFIPHTIWQLQREPEIQYRIPLAVMTIILLWIGIVLMVSLVHIHRLALRNKRIILKVQSKNVAQLYTRLRIEKEKENIEIIEKKIGLEVGLYDRIQNTPEWPFDREAMIGAISSIGIPILTVIVSVISKMYFSS